MSTYISLMTASLKKDYEFFSQNAWPPSIDELKPYREKFGKTDFSVIVKIDNDTFSAYIEKIPSAKQDHQGRLMYYVVTAQGTIGNNPIANAIKKIAASAVNDIRCLGKSFDAFFTSEYIAKFDDCRHTSKTESDITEQLLAISDTLSDYIPETYSFEHNFLIIDSFEDNMGKFNSSLNYVTSSNQSDGITLLIACDKTINQDTAVYIKNQLPFMQGLIISTNNRLGLYKIDIQKKKTKLAQTPESSPNSSTSSNGSKSKTISALLLISLILNILLAISVGMRYSKSYVQNLEESSLKKDSTISLMEKDLNDLRTPCLNNSVYLDVDKFLNTGDVRIYSTFQDSLQCYDYTFKVFSRDSIGIYDVLGEVFRGKPKSLSDSTLQSILTDFSQKIQPYIQTTDTPKNKGKK